MKRFLKWLTLPIVILFLSTSVATAQKQQLEPEGYGQWQYITTSELSADGNWFAYNISLVDGDGWLNIKKVGSDSTGTHKFMHGSRPSFSNDNKWGAFLIGVSEDKAEKLKKQKKRPKNKLGLMKLSTAEVDTFKKVQSYEFSDNGRYLAMEKYKAEGVKSDGSDLILRDLSAGSNQLIGNVAEFAFNDGGNKLAVLLDASEELGNGVHLYDLPSGKVTVLDSDNTNYKELTWNEDGTGLAFLKESENEDFQDPTHNIHAYRSLNGSTQKLVFDQQKFSAYPDSMRVVDYRSLQWSQDNNTLFFGIKQWDPKKEEAKEDSTTKEMNEDLETSNVELWHWQDDEIIPRQEVMANQIERENHMSAWHLDDERFVQLGSEKFEQVQLTGDQQHAVAYDPKPYEPTFEEEWQDVYLVDVSSGESQKILDKHEFVQTSPDGEYLLYFKDQNWWSYDISGDEHRNLTSNIDSRFENFTNVNGRENRRPWGNGEWAGDDEWVLLYDQYNTYKVWTDGSDARQLTNGNNDKIRYRQVRFSDEEEGIQDGETLYFSMYGDETKDRGYARIPQNNALEQLMYDSNMFTRLSKADSTKQYVYMVQSATNSPDFYHVNQSFEDAVALTSTNPQQEKYHWADDEVVSFTNKDGQKLEGRLIYPANYDPDKEYPMITYIYEKLSQTTHSYSMPSRTDEYNARRYSSEGYFVFMPDITYELSEPGVSAVKSVVPAVNKVLKTGMVNEEQLGLTGHSWGAYQTTFIITQTDLFNSAVAGAPLTNMVSMYNSIYWNSGIPDAKIFETSQGRFPDPWWKDWDNYIDNSPIFNMEEMSTPLMVQFGTDDGAVDFNQGVELYNTMRRMQNPFVMLVYEGENHNLAQEENQIDYANRAFQWHEHYLKGEEAPNWITDGLPFLERPMAEENEK